MLLIALAAAVTIRTARAHLPLSPVGTVVTGTGSVVLTVPAVVSWVGLVGTRVTVASPTARASVRGYPFLSPAPA